MKVLIACEFSGTVRDAFIAKGHDAMSCDLLPTEIPGYHYQGDVMDVLFEDWDMIIAHPPCTYLCNSGVRWLHTDATRWPKLFEAAEFFKKIMEAPAPRIAVENPVMHKYARQLIGGRRADQYIQPWQFGHGEIKATGLWLKGLQELTPTNIVEGRVARVHRMPPGPDRWKERSTTLQGIADAMASQWTLGA